jgi:hypothetical protein
LIIVFIGLSIIEAKAISDAGIAINIVIRKPIMPRNVNIVFKWSGGLELHKDN